MIVPRAMRSSTSVRGIISVASTSSSSSSPSGLRHMSVSAFMPMDGEAAKRKRELGVEVKIENGVRILTINRPHKRNALTRYGFLTIRENFYEANEDDNTKIVVLTGSGNYFSAGNDLINFQHYPGMDPHHFNRDNGHIFESFVSSIIDLEKPLIALVNGPAVGIAATFLGLCDAVYASDIADFSTPFTSLGQTPEGCSSYLFPKIMGYARANQLILFSQKMNAQQAYAAGLLTAVFPDAEFRERAWKEVWKFAKLPLKSLQYSRLLCRDTDKSILHDVNRRECDRLTERWMSDECIEAIGKFFKKPAA